MNILTDVGGVTFTFDKENRKRIWVSKIDEILTYVRDGGNVTDILPRLGRNPYADRFDIDMTFNEEFRMYSDSLEDGQEVLSDMLLNPTATALMEHMQGIALESGELTATAMPGIGELISYVVTRGGIIKGYSTGAEKMPDQFHGALGLHELVGNVRTTFPTHLAKEKSPDDVVEEADLMYKSGHPVERMIDDSPHEIAFWLGAKDTIRREGLGNPTVHLFRRELPDEQTGFANTDLGQIVVVNSLDMIREGVAYGQSSYEPDFGTYDGKFG